MFKCNTVFIPFSVFNAYLCFKTCFLNWMRTFMLWVRQVAFLCIKRPVFGQSRESIHILEYTKPATLWTKFIY